MRISIKRRLLISNVLMVLVPLLLTFALIGVTIFMIIGRLGMESFVSEIPEFPIEQGPPIDIDWSNLDVPIEEVVFVYQLDSGNRLLVLPEALNPRFEGIDLTNEPMLTDIALIPEALVERLSIFEEQAALLQIGMILTLIIFALLVNHFLTRFVFKPIVTSLNLLTEGVHEISVGNLNYRLKHTMGNEFDKVGVNFNEMATRLHEMVEQRKIDEMNRKELIAGISHDLRTPLTSIRTYAEGIELGMATTPEKQAQYLTTIKQKTTDIEHIINQLFLFSKLDIGEFPMRLDKREADIWLTDFVQDVQDEYLEKGLHIELEEVAAGQQFLIDSVQLKNALINLLENSVKYGQVDDKKVSIQSVQNENEITIVITDNGPGVPEEDLDKLFDVFYRSDKARTNPGSGSGLGLAISAKMIEQMGGSIRATNADSGGLQVSIKLPIVRGV